jgi:DNA polymerase
VALNWVIADFETESALDVTDVGAWRYAEDPTTGILSLGIEVHGQPKKLWHPGEPTEELLSLASDPDITWVAFNCQFEKAIWRSIMVPEYRMPDIKNTRWHDIQAVAAMKVLPQNLEDLAGLLALKNQKDMAGNAVMRALSKTKKDGNYDRSPELLAQNDGYCLQDVATESEAHDYLGWLPPGERQVWLLNQRVNERGLALDLGYIRAAKSVVERAAPPLLDSFAKITGGLAPGQTKKLKQWLDDRGVGLPDLRKETVKAALGTSIDGEDDGELSDFSVDDIGNFSGSLPDDAREALRIKQLVGSSSIKKLDKMLECVCSDGIARGMLQYHGTGPGRSAGRLLQPHNFPKPTLKADGELIDTDYIVHAIMSGDPDYVEALIGPPIETVVGGLRHALIARAGRRYISGDYSGIQARLVLALAGQHDKTALMSSGADVYCDMASKIFRRPIDKHKDPWERGIGKNSVLGLGFQMGPETFRIKYAKDQTLEFCNGVVNAYRREWAPLVPEVWYSLQAAATDTVWEGTPHEAYGVLYQLEGIWLSARLPSGRKMWYAFPRKVMRAVPWDENDLRRGFTYEAKKMGVWRTIHAFGGQLTENVIMGMERDLMTCAMIKAENEGLPVVLEVHDEIVVEPMAGTADEKMLKQIMLDIPPWAKQIQVPINIDTWTGERYRK